MKVVVVVLSWNRAGAVIDCVSRVREQSAPASVVVVDNGSTDGSVAAIRAAHPDVPVLEQGENTGYVGGVNRGLAFADAEGADYAWLLNDDTEAAPTTLATLLAQATAASVAGLWSPVIHDLDARGETQYANGLVDVAAATLKHNYDAAPFAARIASGSIPIVPGTAMLCDLRLYRAIGPFDPDFFAYWEDIDYCVRAHRAGFACRGVEGAAILHESSGGRHGRSPTFCYYMVRNEGLFVRKHLRGSVARRWRRRWLIDTFEWIAEVRDLGLAANTDACIDGLWDAWRDRRGRRDDEVHAPAWVRRLALAAPYLVVDLLRWRIRKVVRRLAAR